MSGPAERMLTRMDRDDLDHEWLTECYRQLHAIPAGSRRRDYLRGRIDEYIAQNAVLPEAAAYARAEALRTLSD